MRYLKLLVYLILFNNFSSAQTIDWATEVGTAGSANAAHVTADKFGNIFMIGSFASSNLTLGSTTLINNGSSDIFLAKYDSLGNVMWAKGLGGSSIDYGTAITTDSQGNVFVTGYFYSASMTSGSITINNGGSSNYMFIAKYDPAGNIQWIKSHTGNAYSTAWGITVDHSDNILVTGGFQNTVTFATYTLTSGGMFIVKYANDGNVIWAKKDGSIGIGITTDSLNNVFVSGYFNGATSIGTYTFTGTGPWGYSDVYIVKYDSMGTVVWAKSAGGSGLDQGMAVETDNLGNVYFAGNFGKFENTQITFGTYTLTNFGSNDVFLVKYDPAGNVIWANSAGGGGDDFCNGLDISNSGDIYMAGYFEGNSILFGSQQLTNTQSGTRDIFLAKYNSAGSLISKCKFGGTQIDVGNSIVSDSFDNIYFCGTFSSSSLTIGSNTLTNSSSGQFQIYFAKLGDILSSISELQNKKISVMAYPNPFNTSTTINFDNNNSDRFSFNLFNSTGKLVTTIYETTDNQIKIDKNNLAAGLYSYKLLKENLVVASGKLLLE